MISLDRLLSLVVQVERSAAARDIAIAMRPGPMTAEPAQAPQDPAATSLSDADIDDALRATQGRQQPLGFAATLAGLRPPLPQATAFATAGLPADLLQTPDDPAARPDAVAGPADATADGRFGRMPATRLLPSATTGPAAAGGAGMEDALLLEPENDAAARSAATGGAEARPGDLQSGTMADKAVLEKGPSGKTGTSEPAAEAGSASGMRAGDAGKARPDQVVSLETGLSLTSGDGGETGRTLPGLQTERAGVIASFILNAAMIPGWPAQRPIEGGRAMDTGLRHGPIGLTEADVMTYLANSGGRPGLIARLTRGLKTATRRLRLLLGLAMLTAQVKLVLQSLREELDGLAEDKATEQAGRKRRPARWLGRI